MLKFQWFRMLNMTRFSERLDKALKSADKTQSDIAEHLQISASAITQWKNGNTKSGSAENLIKAAMFLGVNALWLATGEGKMAESNIIRLKEKNAINIPIYDQSFGMGNGLMDINQDMQLIRYFATNQAWINENLKKASNSKNVFIITGRGVSMFPTIQDGAAVFIDTGVTEFVGDYIYAIKADDEMLLIKRIQKLAGGGFRLISDNEKNLPEDVKTIQIIGRVIGSMNFNAI